MDGKVAKFRARNFTQNCRFHEKLSTERFASRNGEIGWALSVYTPVLTTLPVEMTVMVGLPVCACIPYYSAAPPLSQPYIYGVFLLADGAMRLQRLAAFDSRITVENGGLMYRYFGLSAFGREQRQQPVVSQLQYS